MKPAKSITRAAAAERRVDMLTSVGRYQAPLMGRLAHFATTTRLFLKAVKCLAGQHGQNEAGAAPGSHLPRRDRALAARRDRVRRAWPRPLQAGSGAVRAAPR